MRIKVIFFWNFLTFTTTDRSSSVELHNWTGIRIAGRKWIPNKFFEETNDDWIVLRKSFIELIIYQTRKLLNSRKKTGIPKRHYSGDKIQDIFAGCGDIWSWNGRSDFFTWRVATNSDQRLIIFWKSLFFLTML